MQVATGSPINTQNLVENYLFIAAVGKALASSGIALVYGGGRRGMMGATALACAKSGGKVLGVIPRAIKESGGEGTGPALASHDIEDEKAWARMEDVIVDSMHERKKVMATRSGAFIGLPGGYGTLEEVRTQYRHWETVVNLKADRFLK